MKHESEFIGWWAISFVWMATIPAVVIIALLLPVRIQIPISSLVGSIAMLWTIEHVDDRRRKRFLLIRDGQRVNDGHIMDHPDNLSRLVSVKSYHIRVFHCLKRYAKQVSDFTRFCIKFFCRTNVIHLRHKPRNDATSDYGNQVKEHTLDHLSKH